MLRIAAPVPNRIDLHLSGPLDADQMRDGLEALFAAADRVEDGLLYYEIADFQWPDFGAIAVKLGQLPQLFRLLGRFRRMVIVSDAAWIRRAAALEGALLPGIEIKAFPQNATAQAEAWLTAG